MGVKLHILNSAYTDDVKRLRIISLVKPTFLCLVEVKFNAVVALKHGSYMYLELILVDPIVSRVTMDYLIWW